MSQPPMAAKLQRAAAVMRENGVLPPYRVEVAHERAPWEPQWWWFWMDEHGVPCPPPPDAARRQQ